MKTVASGGLVGHCGVVGVLGLILDVPVQVLAGPLARTTCRATPPAPVTAAERERPALLETRWQRRGWWRRPVVVGTGSAGGALVFPLLGTLAEAGGSGGHGAHDAPRGDGLSTVRAYAAGMVNEDPGGDELRDAALYDEIELVGQLVVAATSTSERMSQQEIDRLLGVRAETDR